VSLDVGIVAYGSPGLLLDCLASLREHAPSRPMRVLVVDNAAPQRIAATAHEFPEVELIEPGRNLGFAAATNAVIRRTSGEYFLALNPDARVHSGTLDTLLALMDADGRIGLAGPRLVREDGSFDHAARRSFPTPLGALAHFTGLGRRDRAPAALSQYRAPEVERGPVDAVSGAFMLLRRRALDGIGLFDEGYWLYMEDLDLCYRLARSGWVTWYEPSVEATHVKGGSSGRHRTFRVNRAFHTGMARFYRSHYAGSRSPLVNAAVYAGIAARFAASASRSAVERRLRSDA
jgi:GT2 family glycosyltransferase